MPITRSEVVKIADLAKLHFSEDELDTFTVQFQKILDFVEQLKQAPIEGVAPTSHISLSKDSEGHALRDDRVRPSLPISDSLSNAPDPGEGHFRVPKVI